MTNQGKRPKAAANPSTGSTRPPQAGQDLRRLAEARLREKQSGQKSEVGGQRTAEETAQLLHELRVHQIELEMQNEELRRAQTEIEAGRARFFDLYDLAPVGYCTLSEQGLILEANLTAASLLGTARGALVKQPISHFIVNEDQDVYYLHRKKLFETGEVQGFELRLVKPDGTVFWAQLTATAAQADDGAPVCRMTFSDISERMCAEEYLLNYKQIVASTADGIALLDRQYRYVIVNEAYEVFSGRKPEELIGRTMAEYLGDAVFTDHIHAHFDQCLKGETVKFQDWFDYPTLGRRFVEVTYFPYVDAMGDISGIVANSRDITARKQMEQALQQSEERFRTLTTLAPTGIYLTDPQGQCQYANPRWCEMAGMPLSSALGSGWVQGLHPEDRDDVMSAWARMVDTEEKWGREYRFRTPEGKVSWVYGLATTVRDPEGKTIGFVGVNTDITERKRAEAALLEREEQLRSIASSIPGAIYQFVRKVDGTFEIPFMSEGARLLFGRPVAELQDPAYLFDDVHSEDVPGLWASIEASAKDLTPWNAEFRLVSKTAPLRWLRGTSKPVLLPEGDICWNGVMLDITEQKRGDEQTRLQHNLALALTAASDLQQGLRLCLQTALQGSGLDAGGFYLLDETSGGLDFLVPHGLSSEFVQAVSRYEAASDHTRLVMAGSPVYARLEDLGLSLSEAERREGLRFTASIPLHYAGNMVGSMNVASHSVDNIPPANRQVLETIAATATQAIVRLRAQERLRASETLLNESQRLSKVGGWEWDIIRQTMVWTEETYRLHDLSAQEVAPGADEHIRRSAACYGPEHQATILAAFRGCVERGEAYDLEVPFTSVKGRSMWVRTTAQAVWEGNRIAKVVGNLMDITERKRLEAQRAAAFDALQHEKDELERWQSLTIGRELKMIALKKEVNALRKQAGQPEAYKIVEGKTE